MKYFKCFEKFNNLSDEFNEYLTNKFDKDAPIIRDSIIKEFGSESDLKQFLSDNEQKLTSISDYLFYLKQNPNVYKPKELKTRKLTFNDIYKLSVDWHNSLKSTVIEGKVDRQDEIAGDVFLTFDDGFYWVNLNKEYSKEEADEMGHCGRDDGWSLMSLRDKFSHSHVTCSYKDNELGQFKGKSNKKPVEKYHKYIIELLINEKYNIDGIKEDDYNDFSVLDLNEQNRAVLRKNKPKLIVGIEKSEQGILKYLQNKEEGYFKNSIIYTYDNDVVLEYMDNDLDYNILFLNKEYIRDRSLFNFIFKKKYNYEKIISIDMRIDKYFKLYEDVEDEFMPFSKLRSENITENVLYYDNKGDIIMKYSVKEDKFFITVSIFDKFGAYFNNNEYRTKYFIYGMIEKYYNLTPKSIIDSYYF